MKQNQSLRETEIAVIGAGVIGLAIALRLARKNRTVVLIDRDEPGLQASYGNAGHIATEQVFPLASPATVLGAPAMLLRRNSPLSVRREYATRIIPWLTRFVWASRPSSFRRGTSALASLQAHAMESMTALFNDAGIDELLHRRGHLILVESQVAVAAANAQCKRFKQHGIECTWLAPAQVAERVPQLKKDIAGAIYLPGTGHVSNPHTVSVGLHSAFAEAGGQTRRAEIKSVRQNSDNGFVLGWQGGELRSAKVIVSAGAWSAPLAAQLGHPLPLDTERGYNACADGWHGDFDVSIASMDRMTIMTPMDVGLRITGFVEFGGLELPPRQSSIEKLKQHIRELFPDSQMPDMSHWMGFRPSLPDHLPVIGSSPFNPDVLFAFGHQHLGLTLAGITSDIVDALVGGRAPPVDIHPFRIDRF